MKIPLCEISCLCNFLSMICLSMKCLSMKCLLMKCLLMKYLSMKCLSLKCLGHALSFRTIHRAELVDRTLEQYFNFFLYCNFISSTLCNRASNSSLWRSQSSLLVSFRFRLLISGFLSKTVHLHSLKFKTCPLLHCDTRYTQLVALLLLFFCHSVPAFTI